MQSSFQGDDRSVKKVLLSLVQSVDEYRQLIDPSYVKFVPYTRESSSPANQPISQLIHEFLEKYHDCQEKDLQYTLQGVRNAALELTEIKATFENALFHSLNHLTFKQSLGPVITSRLSNTTSQEGRTLVEMGTVDVLHDDEPRYRPGANKRLSKQVTSILSNWLLSHQDYPYPTKEEKESLANAAGVSPHQVTNWMTNIRKRHLFPIMSGRKQPKSSLEFKLLEHHQDSLTENPLSIPPEDSPEPDSNNPSDTRTTTPSAAAAVTASSSTSTSTSRKRFHTHTTTALFDVFSLVHPWGNPPPYRNSLTALEEPGVSSQTTEKSYSGAVHNCAFDTRTATCNCLCQPSTQLKMHTAAHSRVPRTRFSIGNTDTAREGVGLGADDQCAFQILLPLQTDILEGDRCKSAGRDLVSLSSVCLADKGCWRGPSEMSVTCLSGHPDFNNLNDAQYMNGTSLVRTERENLHQSPHSSQRQTSSYEKNGIQSSVTSFTNRLGILIPEESTHHHMDCIDHHLFQTQSKDHSEEVQQGGDDTLRDALKEDPFSEALKEFPVPLHFEGPQVQERVARGEIYSASVSHAIHSIAPPVSSTSERVAVETTLVSGGVDDEIFPILNHSPVLSHNFDWNSPPHPSSTRRSYEKNEM